MRRYTNVVFLLIGLTASMQSYSQDRGLVRFDKSFYIAGEVAWFSLFLPANWDEQEVAVKVIVSNAFSSSHFFIKKMKSEQASGYFQIPYHVQPGIFEFRFLVATGEQADELELARCRIPVYSDLIDLGDIVVVDNQVVPKRTWDDVKVELSISRKTMLPREEVQLQLHISDTGGQPVRGYVTLSVKDAELAGKQVLGKEEVFAGPVLPDIPPADIEDQIYVRGKVLDPENNPLHVNVLGGYSGEENRIFYTRSDTVGSFVLKLDDFYRSKPIQFLGFQYEHPEISVRMPITGFQPGSGDELIYTEAVLDYLELSRIRKKLYQQFQSLEMSLNPEPVLVEKAQWEPDVYYQISEYESFEDMKGFFGELITPLRFRMDEDSIYSAVLFNPQKGRIASPTLNGPPLFIVDNKITRDANFIANMPTVYIDRVELFIDRPKLRDYFQAMGASGVVRIYTTLEDVEVPQQDERNLIEVPGLQQKLAFPAYKGDTFSDDNHRPYFRPQVYWNPSLQVREDGGAQVSFHHSDDTGRFIVEAVFQSDTGKRGNATLIYEVVLN